MRLNTYQKSKPPLQGDLIDLSELFEHVSEVVLGDPARWEVADEDLLGPLAGMGWDGFLLAGLC